MVDFSMITIGVVVIVTMFQVMKSVSVYKNYIPMHRAKLYMQLVYAAAITFMVVMPVILIVVPWRGKDLRD